jgi:hypothetical protein
MGRRTLTLSKWDAAHNGALFFSDMIWGLYMARSKGSRTGRCQGCNHVERVRIERFLAAGASIKGAARKFAIDYHSLRRHWRNHVSAEARAAYIAGAGATKDQLEEIVADESLGLIDRTYFDERPLWVAIGGCVIMKYYAQGWATSESAGPVKAFLLLLSALFSSFGALASISARAFESSCSNLTAPASLVPSPEPPTFGRYADIPYEQMTVAGTLKRLASRSAWMARAMDNIFVERL